MLEISWFICGAVYFLLYDYLFCTLVCKNKYKLNLINIFGIIVMGIVNIIILKCDVSYLKPYLTNISFFLFTWLIYREKFIKMLIWALFIIILITISELIFGTIFVLIFKLPLENSNNNPLLVLVINLMILSLTYVLGKSKLYEKSLDSVLKWYDKNELKSLFIFVILVFIIATFLLYNNFINKLPKELLWVTNLFCVAVFTFIIGFFKEKTNKNKLIYEYDQLLDYVKTYEKLLDEKNKNQHEYKNQLAVIKLMCNNKRTMEYIDSLLNNEKEENLDVLNKLRYIPKGGLKGLIYYKIESMKKNKINIFINVSRELSAKGVWKRCDNNLEDITKILGVYLDNAIEASSETLDKIITLDIYLDDKNIIFEISNTFVNEIDVEKIDNEGFTTKGEGKGYGLSLVKDILKKNTFLEQEREINGNYYIQKLIVKK